MSSTTGQVNRVLPQHLLESALPLVDSIIDFTTRRHRLSQVEAEELASSVRLRLVEHDYHVLRRFNGRSSLRTYLGIVVERICLDLRRSWWGKWRPSVEAQRLGPLAERLEQLLVRDGLSFDEACQILWVNHAVVESERELYALRLRLPSRPPRHFVGVEALATVAGDDGAIEATAWADEYLKRAERTRDALARVLATFGQRDRLIIQLRFLHGLTIAEIARGHGLDQKALYRRMEHLLRQLRAALEAEGVNHEFVRDWLGQRDQPELGPVLVHLPTDPEPSPA